MDERPVIVWFRRDLRVADNPALLHAAGVGAPVVPVYAAGWERDDPWRPGSAGRWWLERSVAALAESLAALGAPLLVLPGTAEQELPALAGRLGAGEVVWNRLLEPNVRVADARVAEVLERDGVATRTFNAGSLFEPEGLFARSGRPFAQFTPFWRTCLSLPDPEAPLPAPARLRGLGLGGGAAASMPDQAGSSWRPGDTGVVWYPGEPGGGQRLGEFLDCCVAVYHSGREVPAIDGTSRLSPHLHFGEIGPRQVWEAVRRVEEKAWRGRRGLPADPPPGGAADPTEGAESFLRQLGWREFAQYILFHSPWIPEAPFRPEFSRFPWQDDPAGFDAWAAGETGYPLVDAGMKQLLTEGWMHNRVRMVAASFLTKDLLIPWQEGAGFFWEHLVDADLANNTLGWQWTAGSGPDAAPYFRVFNPALQAGRYDPAGEYVRRWAGPHTPSRPIVEHDRARVRALAAFHGLREGRS